MSDDAVAAAARTLIAQYGDDAEVIVVLRAAEVAALGDVQALAHWDAVREAIVAFDSGDAVKH